MAVTRGELNRSLQLTTENGNDLVFVRTLTRDDLDRLLDLYSHLHRVDEPLPARPHVEATCRQMQMNPALEIFGAFLGAELISSCTLSIIPNLTRGCRPYALIENVVTHTAYRRRSYARRVISHALIHARTARCYKVMLLSGRGEEQTAFYEGIGFDRAAKQAFVHRFSHVG